jgi:ubiquinone/menaquinone biosynthesis C-methylase UbiE
MLDLKTIDSFLDSLDSAKNDDEMRLLFATFQAPFDLDVPSDPFSKEYRDHQLAIYRVLTGQTYSPSNEKSPFDVELAAVKPFPYMHGSCELVGNQLMAIGFLIKCISLHAGARILEFGPGWGNTTLALAKMGFDVTAIDIEQNFVDLINKRAAMERLPIKTILGDFSLIEKIDNPYDAILYFECFHHSSDHEKLIAAFEKSVKKGGLVCFAAEPITVDFPLPWGLRMDGESIWAIRKNGWLELGFNLKYFNQVLEKYGWRGKCYYGKDSPSSSVIVAKRRQDWDGTYTYQKGEIQTQIGTMRESECVSTGSSGYLAYGPYVELPLGAYRAQLVLAKTQSFTGSISFDVVTNQGTKCLASVNIDLDSIDRRKPIYLDFSNEDEFSKLETRVYCANGALFGLSSISITAIPNSA